MTEPGSGRDSHDCHDYLGRSGEGEEKKQSRDTRTELNEQKVWENEDKLP